jgi:hypothetical protein
MPIEDPRNRELYVVIPYDEYQRLLPILRMRPRSNGKRPVNWSDRKNGRRCDLIEREVAGKLTPDERAELERLQDEFYRYRDQVAPLPLEMLELVKEALERRAAEARSSAAS